MNPTKRFSDRVENYIKYRPGYPAEIINFLREKKLLNKDSVIADIGSGTGILTELLLKDGNTVYAVEPNNAMRNAADQILKDYNNFISVNGTAEDTSLPDNSIDLITSAQAFHWFNIPKAKSEFSRILKYDGASALIWNKWDNINKDFSYDYENLLIQYGTDYKEVRRQELTDETIENFFDSNFNKAKFNNNQVFDKKGFEGRLLSASYAPKNGEKNYGVILTELEKIFNKYNKNGKLIFEYETVIYTGRLNK